MNRTTLQVPLDKSLRLKAERAAAAAGFSSVQEVVRLFLNRFAADNIGFSFYDKGVMLSSAAEKRYISLLDDIKKGKNLMTGKSYNDLISILE